MYCLILHLGHYISLVQPPSVLTLSQEEMCNLMLTELTTGCVDYPDVKCGFIGEVGSGWPLHGECCHWHTHLSKLLSLFFPFLLWSNIVTNFSPSQVLISTFLFSSVSFIFDSWLFQILKEEQSSPLGKYKLSWGVLSAFIQGDIQKHHLK